MKEIIINIPEDSSALVTELVEKLGGSVKAEEKKSAQKKEKNWTNFSFWQMEGYWHRCRKIERRIMDKKILVDTDIIIKSYRGNTSIYKQLLAIKEKFAISVVTAFELLNGANNIKQLASKKELKAYTILHFDSKISELLYSSFQNIR